MLLLYICNCYKLLLAVTGITTERNGWLHLWMDYGTDCRNTHHCNSNHHIHDLHFLQNLGKRITW